MAVPRPVRVYGCRTVVVGRVIVGMRVRQWSGQPGSLDGNGKCDRNERPYHVSGFYVRMTAIEVTR